MLTVSNIETIANKLKADYHLNVKVFKQGEVGVIFGTTRVLFSNMLTAFVVIVGREISMRLIEASFNASIANGTPCFFVRASSYNQIVDTLQHFGLIQLRGN